MIFLRKIEKMNLRYILIFICFGCLVSCGDDPVCPTYVSPINFDLNVEASNIATIEQYLFDNNLEAQRTDDNLFYIINEEGGEQKPGLCNEVLAVYRGYLPNGNVFDMSDELGVVFPLNNVIKGWQEGIPFYGVGGSGVLLIPSKLGYGSNPPAGSGIPENSVLIFDIEVLAF